MCGIVGLFLKNEALEPSLGKMMTTMLATMCERGPDSAGFAIYGGGDDAHVKLTVRTGSAAYDFEALARKLSDALGAPVPVVRHDTHAVLTVPKEAEQKARDLIASLGDGTKVIGAGTRMELYKEVGRPDAVARQFEAGRHGRLAWRRPHPHGDRIRRQPPTVRIRSRPAATSASCTTARCPTTTRAPRTAPRAA